MAKMQEEIVTIKLSKLLRDSDDEQPILADEVKEQLEAVMAELAGAGVLVEIDSP